MIVFLTAGLVTYFLCPLARKMALAFGVLDHPEARKLQQEPVPLMGGAAVFAGLVTGFLTAFPFNPAVLALLASAGLIFVVSFIDDRRHLSARLRIFIQLVASFVVIAAGGRISFLPNIWWADVLEVVITLVWILGITNSFNYLDGVDALCAGLVAVSSLFFLIILWSSGQFFLVPLPLAILGASVAFIPHNLNKKKIFLGDAGSMTLGFLMAGIALFGDWASKDLIRISVPILILGVPIFDMTFTTILRAKEKKIRNLVQWLEYAGRDHFHHYLLDLGLHAKGTVLFILAVSVSLGMSALIVTGSSNPVNAILSVAKSGIMFGLMAVLMVLGRRWRREHLVKQTVGI